MRHRETKQNNKPRNTVALGEIKFQYFHPPEAQVWLSDALRSASPCLIWNYCIKSQTSCSFWTAFALNSAKIVLFIFKKPWKAICSIDEDELKVAAMRRSSINKRPLVINLFTTELLSIAGWFCFFPHDLCCIELSGPVSTESSSKEKKKHVDSWSVVQSRLLKATSAF